MNWLLNFCQNMMQNIRRAGVMAPPQELLTVQVEHNTMQPADTLSVKARKKAGRRIEIINSKTVNVWEQWVTRLM